MSQSQGNIGVFTPRQATSLIKNVLTMAQSVRLTLREMERLEARLLILDGICDRSVGHENPDVKELLATRIKYHKLATELNELGDSNRDRGMHLVSVEPKVLVHFAARRGKEIVLLCWRDDEERVQHWHDASLDCQSRESRRLIIKKSDDF